MVDDAEVSTTADPTQDASAGIGGYPDVHRSYGDGIGTSGHDAFAARTLVAVPIAVPSVVTGVASAPVDQKDLRHLLMDRVQRMN